MGNCFWLGCGLLALLFVLTFCICVEAEQCCRPLWQLLEQAAQAGPSNGQVLVRQVRQHWQLHRAAVAAVADHDPMEQIDVLLEQALLFAAQREPVRFSDACLQLSQLLQNLAGAQQLTWQNLL